MDELTLGFGPGLNVITGETGAGKSILVGSISLCLGDRAHPDVVREQKAEVTAELSRGDESRSLYREVRPDGRTRAKIDGSPATIGDLKDEGARWVELTAQRDGAALLDPATHLDHIDRFAGLGREVAELETLHAHWQTLKERRGSLTAKLRRLRETAELARFQLQEIEAFDPQPGEDAELDSEIRLLEGAETLLLGLGRAVEELDQGEQPVSDRLADLTAEIETLAGIDSELVPPRDALREALDILRQAAMDLANRRDDIQLDPERLEELRARRDQLIRLTRKYGGSLNALLQTWDDLKTRESNTGELEQELRGLDVEMHQHLVRWESACARLSEARRAVLEPMSQAMEEGLRSVGVEHPRFVIEDGPGEGETVEFPASGPKKVGPDGWDRFEFRISFNPGHEPKALHRVASGGELSRMMLLLRGLSPPEGLPPVLVFDEVDAGISGRTARQVGLRLKELSRIRQVILVTHLPQIASLADRHIRVEKITRPDSTEVVMNDLAIGSADQVDEIARLLGGERVTDGSRAAARDLIENAPDVV